MICFVCKGAVKDGFTTFTVDMGKCVAIVKNVPAFICDQCGDTCYSDETSGRLEEIVDSLVQQASSDVAVASYTEKAA